MLEQNWRFLPLRERLLAERLAAGLVYGWWMADRLAGVAVLNPEPEEEDEADAPFVRKLYVGYLDAAPDQRAALAAALRGWPGPGATGACRSRWPRMGPSSKPCGQPDTSAAGH
jgi:hypothetical protein